MDFQKLKPIEEVTVDDLLREAVSLDASDLHLSCGTPPRFRIDGDLLVASGYDVVTDEWLRSEIKHMAPKVIWDSYSNEMEADFSHSIKGLGRFRVNTFIQRATSAAVMRVIPTVIKTLEQLGSPLILKDLARRPKGLVLVTGQTGSGKSTTLAAMIDAINCDFAKHIMTIEDPIEFFHSNKKSLINQREVGSDTLGFQRALRSVLRQDPDVILVGELRDQETISTALTAAETGHLVLGTLHTQSASKTIDRILDSFPAHQQPQVRSQLSETLQAVISQNLVKKIGGGRVSATEILIKNNAVSNNIREGNISQIYSSIQTGKSFGMHTLDQDLQRLVGSGLVDKEEVRDLLVDKTSLDKIATRVNDWSS